MKTKFPQTQSARQRGSVLVMTLIITAIIGFTLASYLNMISAQNRSVARSQVWNGVMPVIEAGIEEALAHLNQNGLTNIFTEGWSNALGMAVMGRSVGDARYVVAIIISNQPIIECTGYVAPPVSYSSASPIAFAQVGAPVFGRAREVFRSVRVTARSAAIFAKGMVAKGRIDFNGNNVSTDSFDSMDPNFSVNGQYSSARRKDNGDVATNSGQAGMFQAGNANIMGRVATGPGGSVNVGANGVVGTISWITSGNTGIEPGRFSDDMNMSFPEVTVPFSGGFAPTPGDVTVTNYTLGSNAVTVTSLPSPLPLGTITTNTGIITTTDYPSEERRFGSVSTNYARVESLSYPTNAVGLVSTSSVTLYFTNSMPNPAPAGSITSGSVIISNVSLPPTAPIRVIATNTVAATGSWTNGTYKDTPPPNWTPPAPGTYVGAVIERHVTTGSNKGWFHDYTAISGYVYEDRLYTIRSVSYIYTNLTYTYRSPVGYTYFVTTTNVASISTERFDYVLDSYDYTMATLSGKIYVRGNARLHVTDSISLSGQDGLIIGPGGRLELYMSGASARISGQGVMNRSGNAMNFMYYGLKSNTSLDLTGNGQFTGVIYAPDASFSLRGGGNNAEDFIGASVTGNVTMNGHFNFHYDENLSRIGPRSRYMITTWNEVAPTDTTLIRNQVN